MRWALLLALGACRTAPAPAPEPAAAPETEEQAVARCVREQPECRHATAVPVRPRELEGCRDRGVAPGPGDPCFQYANAPKAPQRWECSCDACRADAECPQPGHCRAADPCRPSSLRCVAGPRPAIDGCLEAPRTGAPVP